MEKESSKTAHPKYKPTDYELVLASILFLMTRYARRSDILVGRAIEEHLDLLTIHTDQDSAFMINTCDRLKKQWQDIHKIIAGSSSLTPTAHYPFLSTTIN